MKELPEPVIRKLRCNFKCKLSRFIKLSMVCNLLLAQNIYTAMCTSISSLSHSGEPELDDDSPWWNVMKSRSEAMRRMMCLKSLWDCSNWERRGKDVEIEVSSNTSVRLLGSFSRNWANVTCERPLFLDGVWSNTIVRCCFVLMCEICYLGACWGVW